MSENTSAQVDQLYDQLSKMIGKNGNITTVNITSVAVSLMKIVEKYPQLTGEDKKNMVIMVLKKFIEEFVHDEEEKVLLECIIETVLPSMVDMFISLDKNIESIAKKKFASCCK